MDPRQRLLLQETWKALERRKDQIHLLPARLQISCSLLCRHVCHLPTIRHVHAVLHE
ncbi:hypothetical protein [Bacillus velezensis]|uniref:hypothetical protein n=1 Tax=Bacillus velezensis TaxID=492670 RepID=UPI00366C44E6